MRDLVNEIKTATLSGGAVGGLAGVVTFAWSAVSYIQPALMGNSTDNATKADFITMGITWAGGPEIAAMLGVAIGVVKALLLYLFIYMPLKLVQNRCKNPFREPLTNTPSEPQKTNSPETAPKIIIEQRSTVDIEMQEETPQRTEIESRSQVETGFGFFDTAKSLQETPTVVIEKAVEHDALTQTTIYSKSI